MTLTKKQYKDAFNTIVSELRAVAGFILQEENDKKTYQATRVRFNKKLYERYRLFFWEQNSPLEPLLSLYDMLDKYLNNEGARILGAVSKEHLLREYSGFNEYVKVARGNIEALTDNKTASA